MLFNFITIDEEKGVDKRAANIMMVQAKDLKEAREVLVDGMKGLLSDYEVESIQETKIIEIINYKNK